MRKSLLAWLSCVSACVAQSIPIGPFATEDWVEEKIVAATNNIATADITNGLASVEWVNSITDDLISEEELNNLKLDWSSVTNKPHIIDGTDVTNMLPGWVVVPIPPVTVELDPAFTNWLATTNAVIGRVASTNEHFIMVGPDEFKIEDFSGGGIATETDPVFNNWFSTTNVPTWDVGTIGNDSFNEHDTRYVILGHDDGGQIPSMFGIYMPYPWNGSGAALYYKEGPYSWLTYELPPAGTFVTTSDGESIRIPAANEYDEPTIIPIDSIVRSSEEGLISVRGYDYYLGNFVTGSEGTINVGGTDYYLGNMVTGSEGTINVGGTDYYLSSFVTGYDGGTINVGGTDYYLSSFVTGYDGNTINIGGNDYYLGNLATYDDYGGDSYLTLGSNTYDMGKALLWDTDAEGHYVNMDGTPVYFDPDYSNGNQYIALTNKIPNYGRTDSYFAEFEYTDGNIISNPVTGGRFDMDRALFGSSYGDYTNQMQSLWLDPWYYDGRHMLFRFEHDGMYMSNVVFSPGGITQRWLDEDVVLNWQTNGVLKAGTIATVEDLAGLDVTETDPVWTEFKDTHRIFSKIGTPGGGPTTTNLVVWGALAVSSQTDLGDLNDLGFANGVVSIEPGGIYSTVLGLNAASSNAFAFVYSGRGDTEYASHGTGTFNVDPAGGAEGFWIGETSLATFVTLEPVFAGYTDWTFGPSNTYDGCGLKMEHTTLADRPAWALFGNSGLLGYSLGDDDSTSQTFYSPQDWAGGYTLYATRKELTAYRLGSQSNKPLATYGDVSSKASLEAIAPAWKAGNVYTNGDFVMHSAYLYECVRATSGSVWDPIEWKQTSVAEILGNLRRVLDLLNGEAL